MTFDDALRQLLVAMEQPDCILDPFVMDRWSHETRRFLQQNQLIRQSAASMYASCPYCDDHHVEPVMVIEDSMGCDRYYIWCPACTRVQIEVEKCNSWEVDPDGFAMTVTKGFNLKGQPQVVRPNRLWKLGRIAWPGANQKTRQLWLALRMNDEDAGSVAAHIGSSGRDIVLVPHHRPNERIWHGPMPVVLPLTEVLQVEGGRIVVDGAAAMDMVEESDPQSNVAGSSLPSELVGKKMVRRQVKAEIKSLLSDDIMVAAYKQYGSFRKAAEELTKQTGQRIGKDKISRAVERHGGMAAVHPDRDSASVSRIVGSNRRERSKEFLARS